MRAIVVRAPGAEDVLEWGEAQSPPLGPADVRIRVSILCGKSTELRVHDSGRAVPPEIASQLLRSPVRSTGGLGIGLYQAARHAEKSGYVLALTENRDGSVCFALQRAG